MATVQDIKRRVRSVRNTREDHARAGARRRGEAEARAGAHRGHAPLRGPDARADGRHGARELVGARAAAPAEARDRSRRWRSFRLTGDRGLAGRVQLADPAPGSRAGARASERGQAGPLGGRRAARSRLAALQALRARRGVHRLHRPAPLRRRAGDRAPGRRALHGRRGRPGRPRLQRTSSRPSSRG